MSHTPFRFVHAGDLHLEQPPFGIAEVPDHLRELLVESAYWAAERVVEVALAEQTDLLLLAGDVLDPQKTGPRGPLFLVEQFERLRQKGVMVYWSGGRVDPPEAWPSALRLPENVHVFAAGRPEGVIHKRDGEPLVRVIGASRASGQGLRPADFTPDPAGLFSIALVHGKAHAEHLKARGIDYWALGGSHRRGTLFDSPAMAHYPGTPQGRHPQQAGPHGCTLVQVDDQRRLRTTFVPTDVLRWQTQRLTVDESTGQDDLQRRLQDHVQALKEANPAVDLMISWTIAGSGSIFDRLRHGKLAGELLEGLRRDHGTGSPAAWSVSLAAEAGDVLPSTWYEQETICGDFLRQLRRYQADPELPIHLETYLAEAHRADPLGAAAAQANGAQRQRVLCEAARLGVDLLSGEEPQP
jgi:DNA repair exonuclease SbcCD nuclease subunit